MMRYSQLAGPVSVDPGTRSDINLGISAAGTAASLGLTVAGATAWIPVVGPIIAGITLGLSFLFDSKSGQQKIQATKIVDQLNADYLKPNLDGYMNGPRTKASQKQALANFDAIWKFLTSDQGCGNKDLGDAGKRCISERDHGGKYDMFVAYRDPIANDPNVKPDPVSVPTVDPSTARSTLRSIEQVWLPAALLALAWSLE